MDLENKYASKGVATGGLVTGIIGTALGLGVTNGGLGGLLGGCGCGRRGNCGCGGHGDGFNYRRAEAEQGIIAAQQAQIAKLESELFTNAQIRPIEQELATIRTHLARTDQEFRDFKRETREEFGDVYRKLNAITVTRIPQDVICPPIPAATLQQAS